MAAYTYSSITTLVTPGGTLTFNATSGDTYLIAPARCSGLGMPKVRAPVDLAGQTDGSILHDFFLEGRHLLLAGDLVIRSASTEATWVTARDTLANSMVTALTSILRATGTLNFSGGTAITVKCELGSEFPGDWHKAFVFGLASSSSA